MLLEIMTQISLPVQAQIIFYLNEYMILGLFC